MANALPYCGAPPLPDNLSWNLDPLLICALGMGAAAYLFAYQRSPLDTRRNLHPFAFICGWLILTVSFVSPLCNLSVALFSARIAQHMILVIAAAPLLIMGGADLLISRRFTSFDRCEKIETFASPLLFAFVLWFWHMPKPYDATLGPHVIYWSMELSLLVTSLLLWRCLLRGLTRNPAPAIAAGLFTGLQMTGLGALLVFTPRALFSVHFTTTEAWGLSPLQDQQVGGLIMWLPFGLVLAAHAAFAIGVFLQGLDRKAVTAR